MRKSKQICPAGMSLGKQLACVGALFLIILSFALAPSQLAVSSHAQQPAATNAVARNTALIAATREVLKETSEVRQLSILRAVQSSTQSRAEIERAVVKNLDEDISPADMHAAEVTLKKLGLAPPDFQYRALMTRLLTEQVAGYYEPKTRQFHLADWIDVDGQKPIMAHELTHALQDQHFDLRRFEHWPKGDSDAELAAHALIEGDATLAMVLYVSSNPMRALTFLKSLSATGVDTRELDQAPRVLRESLLFPYQEGLNWTRALYKRGGWKDVSQAFTRLPQSTEQVMHPEKYFAREAPVKVALPDITGLLNSVGRSDMRSRPAVAEASKTQVTWKRLTSDVYGEWGTYLLLDQFLKSPTESRRAAAGWAGDRYAVYESSRGQVVYVSISTWDTENDASEFYEAYAKRTNLRYQIAEGVQETAPGEKSVARTWNTKEGAVTVNLSGQRVVVIEGYPETLTRSAFLRVLSQ
ncbi:MAG: hypothetical protein ABR607_06545 [Pyrinomonadaceae bacterium]